MKKMLISSISGIALAFAMVVPAFAHVIVSPNRVGVAKYQEFSMSVPAEKDNPTVGIRLMIPAGLKSVTPNVKAGWMIDEKKTSGDSATVTEIDWTGGSIPSGQRDDFLFQAQVPATETTLKWKAIQEYSDRSTVEWTHDPTSNPEDDSAPPPYSETKIVNDLKQGTGESMQKSSQSDSTAKAALTLSVVALALSVIGLSMSRAKK